MKNASRLAFAVLSLLTLLATGCKKSSNTTNPAEENYDGSDSTGAVLSNGSSSAWARPPAFVTRSPQDSQDIGSEIFTLIAQARSQLAHCEAGSEITRVKIVTKTRHAVRVHGRRAVVIKRGTKMIDRTDLNTVLAVVNLNDQSREIKMVKVDKSGAPIVEQGFEAGFRAKKGVSHGVGTEYDIRYPQGYVVLAIKHAVELDGGYTEVVYTPFTPALNTPTISQAGYKYLVNNISQAQNVLRSRSVRSRAFPQRLVADVVPSKVAFELSISEHLDPYEFERLASSEGDTAAIEELTNRFLVVVGANAEVSANYAVSKAGARGLFQFIPRTYANISRQYPNANLDTSFERGMDNHLNGAEASLLLFDSDLSVIDTARRSQLARDNEKLGQFLAAAYNTGAGRSERAMDSDSSLRTNLLLSETRVYVRKYVSLSEVIV